MVDIISYTLGVRSEVQGAWGPMQNDASNSKSHLAGFPRPLTIFPIAITTFQENRRLHESPPGCDLAVVLIFCFAIKVTIIQMSSVAIMMVNHGVAASAVIKRRRAWLTKFGGVNDPEEEGVVEMGRDGLVVQGRT